MDDETISITHWEERQFDTATERVHRYRALKRDETPPVLQTAPPQPDETPPVLHTAAPQRDETPAAFQTAARQRAETPCNASDSESDSNQIQTHHQTTESDSDARDDLIGGGGGDDDASRGDHASRKDGAPLDAAADRALLVAVGITEPSLSTLLARNIPSEAIAAWVHYAQGHPRLTNPGGFVFSKLACHAPPPPDKGKPKPKRWYSDEEEARFFKRKGAPA